MAPTPSPTAFQHAMEIVQPIFSILILAYAAWNYKLGKRVDVLETRIETFKSALEVKVETYRAEREMELKFLQEQVKATAELLKETERRLASVSERLVEAQTKLALTLEWFQAHFGAKGGEV